MAQGKNKPDLSDLKARLGLKKPGAAKNEQEQESAQSGTAPTSQGPPSQGQQGQAPADGPGPSAGAARQAGPAQAGPAQAGPPGSAPPQASGPPPGAQGPPPGAQARPPGGQRPAAGTSNASAQPAQRSQPAQGSSASKRSSANKRSSDSRGSSGASSQAPAAEYTLDDEDLKAAGSSTFSPAVVILMAVLLGVGILFGWMAANSMQNRDIYNARSEDAARIHAALGEKVAELDKAKKLVTKLGTLDPNYAANDEFLEINKQLAELEIAPTGNILGGNRLLLGPEIIDGVTNYTADARILERMLKEHQRLTANDKEKLKELVEGNEVVKKDQFAVLFDYDHLAKKSGSEDYMPRPGKLVTVSSLEKDEEGKIEVDLLNSDRSVKTPIQGLLPLGKGDIMKSGGENALNRYQARLAKIERQTMQFEQYRKGMMTKLEALATMESAPLLNF